MSATEIIAELPRLTVVELAEVQAKISELVQPFRIESRVTRSIFDNPAIGAWKDRTDLPEDSAEAARYLRERSMRRTEDSSASPQPDATER